MREDFKELWDQLEVFLVVAVFIILGAVFAGLFIGFVVLPFILAVALNSFWYLFGLILTLPIGKIAADYMENKEINKQKKENET
jgi:hypothetical protein